MFPYFYGLDPTYILVIIGAVLVLGASALVNLTFGKYSAVRSLSGMTGAQAAQRILNQAGIYDVSIEHINGKLTDHYDPSNKVLRLSDSVYGDSSVAAIGVAAHECGHAIQHQHGYVPLRLRTAIVPLANFGSKISWPLIILGVFLSWSQTLIYAGIILFSLAVLFQIITLPVEFNASRRAVKILDDSGILYGEEVQITKKVLGAAALTYVAGAAASVLQLLRLIRIFGGNNRD
ncbi:zinc metallopeptidase [Anaerocolumna sp. AGMB13020]|uniref:zinc metallopeptidase n=1 Tax=Anaerocolumna sp. AGMB13020 TaxID=3081750 RepID=UPI002953CBAF|nr:zinc metallopeptidase [Anaerocolumna sp. AGMB13020]WOO36496.1 zinc metallopeptidase [Anaerocolumna sp. AGMB13020]